MHKSKIEKKKFYVMDKKIEYIKDDKFGHKDIAENIVDLILNDDYNEPYNIALIGKWGLGKSSILNIMENELKNKNKKIKVIKINVWKYEKENLKDVYIKEIYEKITGKRISTKEELQKMINTIQNENLNEQAKKECFLKKICTFIRKYKSYIIISLIISLIWELITYFSNGNSFSNILDNGIPYLLFRYFNFYLSNIIYNITIPIVIYISEKHLDKKNIPLHINYKEDYEALLKEAINRNKKPFVDKFVIVIDDLDRLSTNKIVESLDTIKTLMEIEKCIFIVPFDDSIIKNVLDKEITLKVDKNLQVIQSELILDKLFQFRFYVPPLIISDMKEYTLNLIDEQAPNLKDFFEKGELDEIVKNVIVYDDLTTARQIKKIVNTFANNIILINKRIQNGKIEKNLFNKKGKLMIAKISVLQSDFNEFYDLLFEDNNACTHLLEINKGKYKNKNKTINSKLIEKYCTTKSTEGAEQPLEIKKEYNSLLNFLSRTEYITSPDINIYLNANQDKMSLLYGLSANRELISSMKSLNFPTMNKIIKDNAKKEIIIDLLIDYLEIEKIDELPKVIISISNIEDREIFSNEFNQKINNTIEKILKTNQNIQIKDLNLENAIYIKQTIQDDNYAIKLITNYYKYYFENIENDELNHLEVLTLTINNIDHLNDIKEDNIKEYLIKLCEIDEKYIETINDLKISNKNLNKYLGTKFLSLLINNIKEVTEEKEYYKSLLKKLYEAIKEIEKDISTINNQIIELLSYKGKIEICEDIIKNNVNAFTKEEQQKIMETIINLPDENLEKKFNILDCLSYKLKEETNENFELLINQFIDKNYNIINIMSSIDDYSKINKVIKNLNSRIYKNSYIDTIYKDNIQKFSKDQFNDLIEVLSTSIDSKTYKEGRLTSIFNITKEYINYENIVSKFTEDDELLKNENAIKEIIGIINNQNIINKDIIKKFINRIIELIPSNNNMIEYIKKVSHKLSNENIELLSTTTNENVIKELKENHLLELLEIYITLEKDDLNKSFVEIKLNELIDTNIERTVINHMIEKQIKIKDSYNFIFKRIENINELKKYNKLNYILQINDDLINKIIEEFKLKLFSNEQIDYIISLKDEIKEKIESITLEYTKEEKNLIINILKIKMNSNDEQDIVNFQVKVLEKGERDLQIEVLDNFIIVKQSKNKEIIKNAIINRKDDIVKGTLIEEKINNYCKKNNIEIK